MEKTRLDYLNKTRLCFDMLEVGKKYKLENIICMARSRLAVLNLDYSYKVKKINESLKDEV